MLNCDPLHEIHDNFKKLPVVQQGIAVIFVLIILGGLITAIVSPFMSQTGSHQAISTPKPSPVIQDSATQSLGVGRLG